MQALVTTASSKGQNLYVSYFHTGLGRFSTLLVCDGISTGGGHLQTICGMVQKLEKNV